MNQHFVVVGGRGWVLREFIEQATAQACVITLVQEARYVRSYHRTAATTIKAVDSIRDEDEIERVVREVHARRPIDVILSLTEYGLSSAAHVGDRLGVDTPARPEVVSLLRDKRKMRDHLAAHPHLAVRHQSVFSEDSTVAAVRSMSGPAVVKPATSSGSLGVAIVHDENDAVRAFRMASAVGEHVIVEEFLRGPEFSVEAFSVSGSHYIAAVTRKYKLPNLVEIGHAVPGLDQHETKGVEVCVRDFLDAVGLRDGSSHTEVILTANGPRIVESHNRQGGDGIPLLVKLATGVSLPRLEISARTESSPFPPLPTRHRAAAIHFWTAPAGTVLETPDLSGQCQDLPVEVELLVGVGDRTHDVLHSSDRLGWVVTEGDDAHEAHQLAEELVATHPFVIEPSAAAESMSARAARLRRYGRDA